MAHSFIHLRILSVVLWLLACFLPAIQVNVGVIWPGGVALLFGALGLILFVPCWLANPLWLISIFLASRTKAHLAYPITACLAAVLGMSSFFLVGKTVGDGDWTRTTILEFRIGAFVWLAALLIQAAVSITDYRIKKSG